MQRAALFTLSLVKTPIITLHTRSTQEFEAVRLHALVSSRFAWTLKSAHCWAHSAAQTSRYAQCLWKCRLWALTTDRSVIAMDCRLLKPFPRPCFTLCLLALISQNPVLNSTYLTICSLGPFFQGFVRHIPVTSTRSQLGLRRAYIPVCISPLQLCNSTQLIISVGNFFFNLFFLYTMIDLQIKNFSRF